MTYLPTSLFPQPFIHPMAWHQITVTTDEASALPLADFLTEIGAASVTYMDAEDEPIYEPPLNAVKIWRNTQVIALFDIVAHPAVIRALIAYEFKTMSIQSWKQEVLEDQAWERTWLEHFKPMLFGNRLWVCPTGMEQQSPDTVCMTFDRAWLLARVHIQPPRYVWNGWQATI